MTHSSDESMDNTHTDIDAITQSVHMLDLMLFLMKIPVRSADHTILLEAKIVHSLVHRFLDFLPVRASLNELVDILRDKLTLHSITIQ